MEHHVGPVVKGFEQALHLRHRAENGRYPDNAAVTNNVTSDRFHESLKVRTVPFVSRNNEDVPHSWWPSATRRHNDAAIRLRLLEWLLASQRSHVKR